TLKSPALKLATSYLQQLQGNLFDGFKEEHRVYQRQREDYDRARARQAKAGGEPGEPPEEPVCTRLVCADTTVERLAIILTENPRGLLVCRDELGAWLASFVRYKGKAGGSDLHDWLEMHRGESITKDR